MRGVIAPLPQYAFMVPQYAFMAWCLVKHRNNFTFYLFRRSIRGKETCHIYYNNNNNGVESHKKEL
jgi:hypothetical protein